MMTLSSSYLVWFQTTSHSTFKSCISSHTMPSKLLSFMPQPNHTMTILFHNGGNQPRHQTLNILPTQLFTQIPEKPSTNMNHLQMTLSCMRYGTLHSEKHSVALHKVITRRVQQVPTPFSFSAIHVFSSSQLTAPLPMLESLSCCRLPPTEGRSQPHQNHSWWQPHKLPMWTHYTNCWPCHFKNTLEYCHQH